MIINDIITSVETNLVIRYLLRFDFLRQFMNQYLFYSIILTVFKHYLRNVYQI